MNVVLIGMPGCGKSTVGKRLAKLKGMSFVDVDTVIENETGKKLQEIIDEVGNEAFLRIEAQALAGLECRNCVVAPGGSTVLTQEGVAALKSLGPLVYLRHSFEEINSRVRNLSTRGVTMEKGQTFRELYDYRVKIYESVADYTVDCERLSVDAAARSIMELLKK